VRVAYVCLSKSWGDPERSALAWAKNLAEREHEVWLIVPEGSRLSEEARGQALKQVTVPLLSRRFGIRALFKVRSFLGRHDIDIIHAQHPHDLWPVYGGLFGRKRPKAICICDELRPAPAKWVLIHRFPYRKISGAIVPTPAGKRHLVTESGLPTREVRVIPHGFDPAKYETGAGARDRMRGEIEAGDDQIVVGSISMIEREKGQFELVEAVRTVLRHFPKLKLVIAGEPSTNQGHKFLKFLRQRTHEYHMDEVVVFTGADDVPGLLSAFDIFAMPALDENFPNRLAEAMLSGLACVSTDGGGTPEILEGGKAGLLVPSGSAEGLSRALTTLIENPELRHDLAERGRQSARERFDLRKVMKQIEDFYASL
jgi:glycosyltransferase involved in cell wall biosynthesis